MQASFPEELGLIPLVGGFAGICPSYFLPSYQLMTLSE